MATRSVRFPLSGHYTIHLTELDSLKSTSFAKKKEKKKRKKEKLGCTKSKRSKVFIHILFFSF